MHLAHAHDLVEPEASRQPLAGNVLHVLREHRAGEAPLRARREAGDETERAEGRRTVQAVLDRPRRRGGRQSGVTDASIAATIAPSAPMSQNRIVTCDSGQPIASRWWWNGAIRKTRFPRSL